MLTHSFAGELTGCGSILVRTRDGVERRAFYTGNTIIGDRGEHLYFRVRVGVPLVDARELWIRASESVEVDEPAAAPRPPDVYSKPEGVRVDDRFGRFGLFHPALGPVVHYGGK